jgi:hypothetical protein
VKIHLSGVSVGCTRQDLVVANASQWALEQIHAGDERDYEELVELGKTTIENALRTYMNEDGIMSMDFIVTEPDVECCPVVRRRFCDGVHN